MCFAGHRAAVRACGRLQGRRARDVALLKREGREQRGRLGQRGVALRWEFGAEVLQQLITVRLQRNRAIAHAPGCTDRCAGTWHTIKGTEVLKVDITRVC